MLRDMPAKRGQVRNEEVYSQIIDWSGVRYKKITCTDIDRAMCLMDMSISGSIDIQGKLFILIDVKGEDVPFENGGQKWHYEALINNLNKPAYAIIASHNTPLGQEIPAHECVVEQCYHGKKMGWRKPKSYTELKEAIDRILIKHGFADYVDQQFKKGMQ